MPREYRHIQEYEQEIIVLRDQGFTYREIGERLGFKQKKIKHFGERYHNRYKDHLKSESLDFPFTTAIHFQRVQ